MTIVLSLSPEGSNPFYFSSHKGVLIAHFASAALWKKANGLYDF